MSMTENEAIRELEDYFAEEHKQTISFAAITLARKALEEIQQYRAIGTIEEFKALKEHMKIIQEAYENTDGYKDGYAKAIDEFAERLKYEYGSDEIHETIDEIAEEMRGAE